MTKIITKQVMSMSNFSFLKTEDGVLEILGHKPDRFGPIAAVTENILRGPSELSVVERELIFAFVSACNACSFCMGAHQSIAQSFGLEEGLLESLISSGSHKAVDLKLQTCLNLAKKIVEDSSRVVKHDVSALIDAGWSEETAHDVISIAALATFYNMLVNGHGVSGSSEYFNQAAELFGPDGSYSDPAI